MCGLPASGKTTTAERLHAHAGGVLIRSCDVYQELGISLPDSVRRTEGFTRDVTAYEQARDAAYARMLSLLDRVDSGGPGPRCDLARRFPMASIPSGPTNWGSYAYTPVATAGTFVITNSGDGTSVSLP